MTVLSLRDSYRRALLSENKSPKTVKTYCEALGLFARHSGDLHIGAVSRQDVQGFIADLLARFTPGTASNRYRALKTFFRWAVEEGEIPASPMDGMKPPRLPEAPPPVVTEDVFRALIRTCDGNGFEERRDAAIFWLLLDTGVRNAELIGMQLGDLDLDQQTLLVMGKGRRTRVIGYGRRSTQALDRYLRVRGKHPQAHSPCLWLGTRGPLQDSAIRLMLRRRCARAGLPAIHPHQFRHTFTHMSLAAGASEGDVMQLAGWKSRQMLNRYGAAVASERARQAHRKFSPGDQI